MPALRLRAFQDVIFRQTQIHQPSDSGPCEQFVASVRTLYERKHISGLPSMQGEFFGAGHEMRKREGVSKSLVIGSTADRRRPPRANINRSTLRCMCWRNSPDSRKRVKIPSNSLSLTIRANISFFVEGRYRSDMILVRVIPIG